MYTPSCVACVHERSGQVCRSVKAALVSALTSRLSRSKCALSVFGLGKAQGKSKGKVSIVKSYTKLQEVSVRAVMSSCQLQLRTVKK